MHNRRFVDVEATVHRRRLVEVRELGERRRVDTLADVDDVRVGSATLDVRAHGIRRAGAGEERRGLDLVLTEVVRGRTSITASCSLDDLRFHATVWYQDVDLDALARTHGEEALDRIALHVALFQQNAIASLRPDVIDLGAYVAGKNARLDRALSLQQELTSFLRQAVSVNESFAETCARMQALAERL